MKKTVLGVTLSKLIGLLIFLFLLGLANMLKIDNSSYLQTVQFLNKSLGIIILFSIFFYLGELFSIFEFPINLPSPVLNALGGVFLATFLFRIFYIVGDIVSQDFFAIFRVFEPLLYLIIFFIVIIAGYVSIFRGLSKKKEKGGKPKKRRKKKK